MKVGPLVLALMLMCPLSHAARIAPDLRVGDKAPDFEIAKAGQGKPNAPALKLSDFKGKKNVLVAFYPKAFTPGCTEEMCGFRNDFSQFRNADTEIVAVSVDPQEESDRFKKEKLLQFHVVGDPEKKIIDAYRVPLVDVPEKGKLAKRCIFLIDKKGVIRYIDPAYDVKRGKEVLYKEIEELKKPSQRVYPGRVCPTC